MKSRALDSLSSVLGEFRVRAFPGGLWLALSWWLKLPSPPPHAHLASCEWPSCGQLLGQPGQMLLWPLPSLQRTPSGLGGIRAYGRNLFPAVHRCAAGSSREPGKSLICWDLSGTGTSELCEASGSSSPSFQTNLPDTEHVWNALSIGKCRLQVYKKLCLNNNSRALPGTVF